MGHSNDPLRGGATESYSLFKDLSRHEDSNADDSNDSDDSCTDDEERESEAAVVQNASSVSGVAVISANVTVPTRARLEQVLKFALSKGALVIALQETRHPEGGFVWAHEDAAKAGFRVQWSIDAGLDTAGKRHPGGTALLWSETLGRSEQLPSETHRCTGRRWGGFSVWSIYGPARKADTQWFTQSLSNALNPDDLPSLAVGDHNWKKIYGGLVAWPWTSADTGPTVISGQAKPTWALAAHAAVSVDETTELLGIPHHKAVVAIIDIQTKLKKGKHVCEERLNIRGTPSQLRPKRLQ